MTDTSPEVRRLPANGAGALRWTCLDRAATDAWSALTNLLARTDGTDEFYSADDLAEELAESGFDPTKDSWAVWDGDALVAFGQLRVGAELVENRWCQALLDGGVHPDWRRRGIGTCLMEAMELRARELGAQRHPAAALRLRVPGGLPASPVRPMLERRGYRAARYFTDMRRPLPGTPVPDVDERVRPYAPGLAERVRLAHNDAFATHWGSTARTPSAWRDWLGSRSFRPATSTVCLDDTGDVLSYVLTYQWVDGEIYIGQVGTRQRARGRGLARACLIGSLRAAASSPQYRLAELTVDSDNPTGAGALYESVGFVPIRTAATFVRDEPPPGR